MDDISLTKCREVAKSWKKCIDGKNLLWIQIANIPKILEDQNTYLHIAAKHGQTKMFERLFEAEDIKNPKDRDGKTPFHLVCEYQYFQLVEMILLKSAEYGIDLNAKDRFGKTAFHFACSNVNLDMAQMLMQRSAEFNIDLNVKDIRGETGFHLAVVYCNELDMKGVEMLVQRSSEFNIDLNDLNDLNRFIRICNVSYQPFSKDKLPFKDP